MELCGVDPSNGQIAGMALVPSGPEVALYVPLFGTEPELETDQPVWVIQLQGKIRYRSGTFIDPTCVVSGGIPYTLITHGFMSNGVVVTPEPVPQPPTRALPSLAP
jgi:hypothetical protein